MTEVYIGLMSGTSLDGVDGVLVEFAARRSASADADADAGTATDAGTQILTVLAHRHCAFDAALAGELLALNTAGTDELHRAALAGNALARVYGEVVKSLLELTGTPADRVVAVGAHGQTVRHRPREFDGTGYTLQLGNPALLAELCGIDVVADLRSRDVAAGGLGAPLVPAFHRAVFARNGQTVVVLNIGGIANLTSLHADGSTTGFDCGPGNALMDHWCRQNTGQAFDDGGAWAASGTVLESLLLTMLGDPYFGMPPPKSTGRDLFNPTWFAERLRHLQPNGTHGTEGPQGTPRPQDIQATLAELTASTGAQAVRQHAGGAHELLVCGGGALNGHLLRRLKAHLPGMDVMATDARGLPATQVEACAFAWLARAFCHRECASLAAVTGAAGPRLLGALYPA